MDSNLDRPFRIEDPVEDRLSERAAVMKLGSLECSAGIAVRVDMNHAHRPIPAKRLENRVGDRVVTAHGERDHARGANRPEKGLDVGVTPLQTETTFHRHVADVRSIHMPNACSYGPILSTARTARGPSRAPARLVTPRSIGTPTSTTSKPPKFETAASSGR